MGTFISLGKYNTSYKYLWIYIAIRLINDYFFGSSFPKQLGFTIFEPNNYPPSKLIQGHFNYLGGFICSIFFYYYEKRQTNTINLDEPKETNDLNGNQIEYIHNIPLYTNGIPIISIVVPLVLSIISLTSMSIFLLVGLNGLDFWIFDLFFISLLTIKIFGKPIYGHEKIAILIILIFSTLFKTISTIIMARDDENILIYKDFPVIIPFGILAYISFSFLRNYSLCKIKWLLEIKSLSISKMLFAYNSLGIIILFIACMVSNFVKCVDKEKYNNIDIICNIVIIKDDIKEYYFDEYTYFFSKLWKKDINTFLNIFYIILFLIELFLNFLTILYPLLIIKHLNQEFYLCPFCIYYFITKILIIIKLTIQGKNVTSSIFDAIAEGMSIIGTLIYLELIELKFFNLNRELKKNIEMRAVSDYDNNNLLHEENYSFDDYSVNS